MTEKRDELMKYLNKKNISIDTYPVPLHMMPTFKNSKNKNISEKMVKRC